MSMSIYSSIDADHFLYIYLSIPISIYINIYIYISICLCLYLSICSIHLSIYLSITIHLPAYQHLPIYPGISPSLSYGSPPTKLQNKTTVPARQRPLPLDRGDLFARGAGPSPESARAARGRHLLARSGRPGNRASGFRGQNRPPHAPDPARRRRVPRSEPATDPWKKAGIPNGSTETLDFRSTIKEMGTTWCL